MPVDDNLALLVGRIILAFGNLDQQITHSITLLQNTKEAAGVADAHETIDARFSFRLKHLRRLMVELSGGNDDFLTRYDRLQLEIQNAEGMRGNLAHGIMAPFHDRISVYDAKEFAKSGNYIDYPKSEVEALPDDIFDLVGTLFRLRKEAQKLFAQ